MTQVLCAIYYCLVKYFNCEVIALLSTGRGVQSIILVFSVLTIIGFGLPQDLRSLGLSIIVKLTNITLQVSYDFVL